MCQFNAFSFSVFCLQFSNKYYFRPLINYANTLGITMSGKINLWINNSKYVVDSVEKKWVFGWQKKNFSGKKNPDLWKRFLQVYVQHKVKFIWIKGHNENPENERCDELAVAAAMGGNLEHDHGYVPEK